MSIQLLLGPERSGKTSSLLADLSAAIPKGQGILIVPSEAMAQELRAHLLLGDPHPSKNRSKRQRPTALMGDVVLSWNRFIEKAADARRPVLSAAQAVLFLHRLLSDHPLRYFKMKRRSLGLARQCAEAILALKRNGIDPPRLARLLETRGSLKENDLLTLFTRYEEERRARGLLDEGDLSSLAMEKIAGGQTSLLAGTKVLLFDAFHSFRPGQMAVIGELKKALHRADIRIAFPQVPSESPAAASLEKGEARLRALADAIVVCKPQRRPRPEIKISSARSPIQEARAHARLIAESAHDKKIDPREVALVFRGGSPFLDLFCEEARNSGLFPPEGMPSRPMRSPLLHELFSPPAVRSWPEEATPQDYARLCEEFVRDRRSIASWNEELSHPDADRAAVAQSFQAVAALEELLQKVSIAAVLMGAGTIGRDAFAELLISELSAAWTAAPAPDLLPCRLVPFEAGLALPVRRLFVPQMAEGVIPRPQGERLFFSEADRLAPVPDTVLDEIFPTGEETLAEEALLFEGCMAKARDRILLTYPLIDEGAREAAPSSFLDDYPDAVPLEIFPAITAGRDRKDPAASPPEHQGRITSKAARALVRERFTNEPLSPTRLEKYAACPFVFFAEKVLGLSPLDEETPEMVPKDRGTIIHALLERFYRNHLDRFRQAARDPERETGLRALLDEILGEVLAGHPELVGRTSAALAPLSREAILTMAWQAVRLELAEARGLSAPLGPTACEWAFGKDVQDALAIPIEGDRPAFIGGRIDRIDADERRSRFLIVDYKTGARIEAVKNDILNGLHLQLPLYVEAVRRFLFPGALPLGGLLLAVQQGEKRHGFVRKEFNDVHYAVGRSHSAMDDGIWEKALAAALSAAAAHTQRIRDGQFGPEPAEECPRHCDYEAACRYIGRGAH